MTTKSHFEVMSSDQCNNAEKRKSVNVDCKGKEIEISVMGINGHSISCVKNKNLLKN